MNRNPHAIGAQYIFLKSQNIFSKNALRHAPHPFGVEPATTPARAQWHSSPQNRRNITILISIKVSLLKIKKGLIPVYFIPPTMEPARYSTQELDARVIISTSLRCSNPRGRLYIPTSQIYINRIWIYISRIRCYEMIFRELGEREIRQCDGEGGRFSDSDSFAQNQYNEASNI